MLRNTALLPRDWLLVAGATTLAFACYGLLAISPARWHEWRPATCMPDRCFCEGIRDGAIRQPANTASGLAFLPAAATILVLGGRRRPDRNRSGVRVFFTTPYCATVALIGIATAFYHASLSFWGQTADVLGMYLVATLVLLINAARLRGGRAGAMLGRYLAGNALLLMGLIVVPEARRYVFALLVVAILIQELAIRRLPGAPRPSRHFQAALGVFLLGFVAWTLDITRRWCDPTGYLQGHALWHVAGAVALVLLYRHYRTTMLPV